MKHVGIFSGSFNPIHIGHLALANWLCEYEVPDEVWFLVTPQNPLKETDELMDDHSRMEWVRLAIEDYPHFKACDFEFHLPRPSYSVDTMRALRNAYPDCTFYFIMGSDNWQNIGRWKESERFLQENQFLIYPRPGYAVTIPEDIPNCKIVDAPVLEISSTFIRQSLQDGKDIRFFLPSPLRHLFFVKQFK